MLNINSQKRDLIVFFGVLFCLSIVIIISLDYLEKQSQKQLLFIPLFVMLKVTIQNPTHYNKTTYHHTTTTLLLLILGNFLIFDT